MRICLAEGSWICIRQEVLLRGAASNVCSRCGSNGNDIWPLEMPTQFPTMRSSDRNRKCIIKHQNSNCLSKCKQEQVLTFANVVGVYIYNVNVFNSIYVFHVYVECSWPENCVFFMSSIIRLFHTIFGSISASSFNPHLDDLPKIYSNADSWNTLHSRIMLSHSV